MTTTTFDKGRWSFDKGRWSTATGALGFLRPGFLREIIQAARDRTGPFGFMTALKRKSTMACQEPDHGLAAISNYARFIAAHPDMPASHKDRFLGEIVRCCRELRTASM